MSEPTSSDAADVPEPEGLDPSRAPSTETDQTDTDQTDTDQTDTVNGVGAPSHVERDLAADGVAVGVVAVVHDVVGDTEDVVRVRRLGWTLLLLIVGVVGAKLGFVGGPDHGPLQWQPWTWRPGPIFRSTLTTGGDTGAHVWTPDFLRRELVPSWRVTGWSKDWYAGFPVMSFYFPLPMWSIVGLGSVVGLNVGFKLVSIAGIIGLPFAARFLGRRIGLDGAIPFLLAFGAVTFVLDPHFDILGGNILSTMAGEFSFSVSLCFAVVFFGLWCRLLQTGRGRAVTAASLAATGLSHLLPTMFAGVGAVVLFAVHQVARPVESDANWPERRRQFLDGAVVATLAGLLGAFWLVPFRTNLAYSNDMGWERGSAYAGSLFPPLANPDVSGAPVYGVVVGLGMFAAIFASVRFVGAAVRRSEARPEDRLATALGVLAGASAAAFALTPQFRILNERALPFYFLCLCLLAPLGLAHLMRVLRVSRRRTARPVPGRRLVGWAAALVALGPGFTFGALPGWLPIPKLDAGGLGVQRVRNTDDPGFAWSWSTYNYDGYQALGEEWEEFRALMDTMGRVGREHGCGRALWDYEDELDRYGTSMGLMLLPYWTKGCIGSMEGLYFESSASVPYHFVNAALLSARPSNPVRGLEYPELDVATGTQKLKQWGVKYFMGFAPAVLAQARANPDLRLVASTPYTRECSDEERSARTCPTTWEIYEVLGSSLVEGLTYEPAVVTGIEQSQTGGWLDVAIRQYLDPAAHPVPYAASGPKTWQRVRATVGRKPHEVPFGLKTDVDPPQARTLPTVTVSDIVESDDHIRFTVDRPGVPVVVKVSHYPNWTTRGAEGPFRLAPNLMVVIPTSTDVELRFTRGAPELVGMALTAGGLAALAVVGRADRRTRRAGRTRPTS